MASLLIRNVDDALHGRLKEAAARHRRSLEEEVRELLRSAVARQEREETGQSLVDLARSLFGSAHGMDLDIPARGSAPSRVPADFSGPEWGHLDGDGDEPTETPRPGTGPA